MIWVVCLVGLVKHAKHIEESLLILFRKHTLFTIGTALFLIAATISIFTAVDLRAAAGEWKAFYIEPFALFLILYFSRDRLEIHTDILLPLVLSGFATSILAIVQHFTGWMVPWDFWENGASYRVTAWYGFPNGVGLFLAPLVVLAAAIVWQRLFQKQKNNWATGQFVNWVLLVTCYLLLVTGPLAVLYAKSTGGLIGILAGVGILFLINKKTRFPAIAIGVIGIVSLLSIPSLASIREELFFKDRSGQIRLSMWQDTVQLLKERPLLGAGLASYDERIIPYHTTVNGEGIEIFSLPHNLFLSIYVNLGLLGIVGFLMMNIGLFLSIINKRGYWFFVLGPLIAISIMGLVDTPYIRNDLSVFFWVLPLLLVTRQE
ncbi:MAG: O-antigen polymerase [Candidatus Magasanikbacteria bacterium GW2011_GWC2_42_27]|nr:MAG: O-antigen polymerase [Candidatus Magasanikbacteria bacterium GW2011_GWC2_42_27]